MQETARSLWQKLESDRRAFIDDARDAASLTLPRMFPPGDNSVDQELPTPFQSVGSRGVKALASKFVLALLPPNSPFFQLEAPRYFDSDEIDAAALQELEQDLLDIELEMHTEVTQMGLRPVMYELWKHLLVAGTSVLEIPDEGPARHWGLGSFVQKRDTSGALQLLILRERKATVGLDPEIRAAMREDAEEVELYTVVKRVGPDIFMGWQEVGDQRIPSTAGVWRGEENLPYIPVGMNAWGGASYAVSFCTELIGDLRTLEGLSESISIAAAIGAHKLFLIDPNGATRIRDVAGKPSGSAVPGREQDVSTLDAGNDANLVSALNLWREVKNSLEQDFLLTSSVQRNAERVTAEEIRTLVGELDEAFGGAFSTFSDALQRPVVKRIQRRMEKRGAIPRIPNEITIRIITGLEGLGRNQEVNRLRAALSDLIATVGPEAAAAELNTATVAARYFVGHGVGTDGLLKSDEQKALEKREAALGQLSGDVGAQVVQGINQQNQAR